MHAPRRHTGRMKMTITLSDYRRLPAEDRNDPGVLWHVLIDDKGPSVQRDYDPCQFGTSYRNHEIGE
jgi:hypothetical protein